MTKTEKLCLVDCKLIQVKDKNDETKTIPKFKYTFLDEKNEVKIYYHDENKYEKFKLEEAKYAEEQAKNYVVEGREFQGVVKWRLL